MRALALMVLSLSYLPTTFIQPFCGVLLWTWFSIMNPHRVVWGFASELPYAMIIALTTLLALVMSREPRLPPRSMVTFAFIGMMVVFSICTLFAIAPRLAFPIWDRVMKELLFALITLTLLTTKARIHAFVWVLVLSLGYFGLKGGVFTIVTGGGYRIYGPPNSYIADNNHIACALVMILPFINYLRIHSQARIMTIGMTVLLGLTAMAAIFTFSRGGMLAIAAGGAVLWWRSSKKMMLTIMIVAGAALLLTLAPQQLFDRFSTIGEYQEDNSANARFTIWRDGLEVFKARPLVGGGFRATYSREALDRYVPGAASRAVHNSHLEILVENGIFGFLLHLLLLFATWNYASRVMRMTRRRPDLAWAYDLAAMTQVSFVAYFVGGTFLSLGYYDGWYSLPILSAALYIWVRKSATERTPAVRPIGMHAAQQTAVSKT